MNEWFTNQEIFICKTEFVRDDKPLDSAANGIKKWKLKDVQEYIDNSKLDPYSKEYKLMLYCQTELEEEYSSQFWYSNQSLTARSLLATKIYRGCQWLKKSVSR